jgi:hypothetical protein
MSNQSQQPGSGKAGDAVGTGMKKSHAAGSGSSTGDPGNPRGPQPQAGKNSQAPQPGTPVTSPDPNPPKG